MARKMVSVQTVDGVYPIEDADRIEKVKIGGLSWSARIWV